MISVFSVFATNIWFVFSVNSVFLGKAKIPYFSVCFLIFPYTNQLGSLLCSWRSFGALHFLFSGAEAWLLQCRPPLKGMAGEPSLSRASMHLDEVWHYCSVAGRSNFDLLSVLFVWTKCTMGPCNNDHNASPLNNRCIANNTIKSRQQKQWNLQVTFMFVQIHSPYICAKQ